PGRPSAALVLVTGPIVDALAAVVLGGRAEGGRNARRPSAASMRLFERPGGMGCDVLRTAWREEQSVDHKPATDPERGEAVRGARSATTTRSSSSRCRWVSPPPASCG